jgi:hypothetical protein
MKTKVLFLASLLVFISVGVIAQSHLKSDPDNVIWVTFDEYQDGMPVNENTTGANNVVTDSTLHGEGVLVDYTQDGKFGKCATFVTNNYPWEGQALFVPYESVMDPVDNTITLAAWIKPTQLADWMSVIDWGTNANGDFDSPYSLGFNAAGAITLFLNWGNLGGPMMNGLTAGYVETDTWQHIAATWDGVEALFYYNGEEVGYEAPAEPLSIMTGFTEEIVIGCGFGGGDECYDGQIDEVRAFNRVLGAAEIDTLMNQTERGASAIQTVTNEDLVNVFYNELSGTIRVVAKHGVERVNIYSVLGNRVRSMELSGKRQVEIATEDMSSGIYFVQVNGSQSKKVLIR